MNKNLEKIIDNYENNNYLTEQNILSLKTILNNSLAKKDYETIDCFDDFMLYNLYCVNLTEEQNKKGYDYLIKRYFTKYGRLRNNKDITFKSEILSLLEEFYNSNKLNLAKHLFTFSGFVKISNGIVNFICPVYKFSFYKIFKQHNTSIRLSNIKSFKYFHFLGKDYEYNEGKNGKYLDNKFYIEYLI